MSELSNPQIQPRVSTGKLIAFVKIGNLHKRPAAAEAVHKELERRQLELKRAA